MVIEDLDLHRLGQWFTHNRACHRCSYNNQLKRIHFQSNLIFFLSFFLCKSKWKNHALFIKKVIAKTKANVLKTTISQIATWVYFVKIKILVLSAMWDPATSNHIAPIKNVPTATILSPLPSSPSNLLLCLHTLFYSILFYLFIIYYN